MNTMWRVSLIEQENHHKAGDGANRFPFETLTQLAVLLFLAVGCRAAQAQGPPCPPDQDCGAPHMKKVTDVLPGHKYLLRNDDLSLLKISQKDSTITISATNYDTKSSHLDGSSTTNLFIYDSTGVFNPKAGVVASEASGRMYNLKHDTIGLLNAAELSPGNTAWLFTPYPPDQIHNYELASRFKPHGTVYTQLVMGDFNGDALAEGLAFYASVSNGAVEWGMQVVSAGDPNVDGSLREGPQYYGNTQPVPVTGTVTVGDFNGDGRDEIAVLLTDYQTIAFYQVDPKTLAITPVPDANDNNRPLTVKLPDVTMISTQVALAAGRFRQCGGSGNPCQANGITNADLVVFGQIENYNGRRADYGFSVIPIKITPNYNSDGSPSGTFSATVVPHSGSDARVSTPYFRFPDYHSATGAQAQAAPLVYYPQMIDGRRSVFEQLVTGIQTTDGASYLEIGSFVQNGNLDTFDWESETKREFDDLAIADYLANFQVGNFDHQNSDGSHNGALQIETYEWVLDANLGVTPYVTVFDLNENVPQAPFSPPLNKKTDWLHQVSQKKTESSQLYTGTIPSLRSDVLIPADIQGRSLVLGSPTVLRVTNQIQPDLVLAMPPMHVDYVAPKDTSLAGYQPADYGCNINDTAQPCIVNVSVMPNFSQLNKDAFATKYDFTSSSSTTANQSSTTSWGVSVKASVGVSASFNDGLENASLDIKNTTKASHDETVKNTYSTYKGKSESIDISTGFADHLRFTKKDMNIYYYPVLGCDSNEGKCTNDGTSAKTYVEFSVPDQVRYYNVDGYTFDWYQPVYEKGNVLSYPWTSSLLQKAFTDKVQQIAASPECFLIGHGQAATHTSWSNGVKEGQSSGSASSFSDELSMSGSEGLGVEGVDSADVNWSLDIAAHTSLNTLNESASSLSASHGITLQVPDFGIPADCCTYGYAQYIFGLKNTKHPASEDACSDGQTQGCVPVKDPDGSAIAVATTGPLFTGYIASPVNGDCPGTKPSWWQDTYSKPDIAFNHPEHWLWNPNSGEVSFQDAKSTNILVDNGFYIMKGFFINKKSAGRSTDVTLPSSPNLTSASVNDPLTLTARVYNYSLADTTAPVHVRFYGQLYCNSSGEASCTDWKTQKPCSSTGDVCGDSFEIGEAQPIPMIPGFNSGGNSSTPNWQLSSVDFDPTQFAATRNGNLHMIFWVVAWMQDNNGLGAEMADHGLTAIPGADITQITQVPTQEHSNNVGMYPVYGFFQLLPAGVQLPGSAAPGSGSLKSIALSTGRSTLRGKRTKIEATLQAAGVNVKSVNITYYDGDPAKNGQLLDVQSIASMNSDADYYHRTFFTPESCGVHTLYVSAWVGDTPAVQASTTTNVTINFANEIQSLISSTQGASITDAALRSTLLSLLNTTLQSFQQNQAQAGATALGQYVQQLSASSGKGIDASVANQLTAQSGAVLSCGTKGFSLSALPSLATVSAGSTASYSIALTPSGGFNSAVSLTCTGAPQGTACDVPSPSVTLDGVNQSRVTVTITTSARTRSAGITGNMPISGAGRLKWLLMFLAAMLSIVILQRGRVRYPIVGCVVLLALFSVMGCGNNVSQGTPPGYYPITIQAVSGSTTQTLRVNLHVQ
jgi:hypothetical protein